MLTRSYNQQPIRQREDGYLSLTDMAKAAGKRVNHWLDNGGTQEFLAALRSASREREGIPGSAGIPVDPLRLVMVNESAGPNEDRGTWAHPQAAHHFAMWCSPAFAVQVTAWVEEIRTRGYAIDTRRPLDFAALVRDHKALPALALELVRVVEEQAQQLAEAAPKVEAHDRLMNAQGSYSLMEAGRILGRQPKKLIDTLVVDKVLYRDNDGVPMPTAEYRERGLFEVVTFAIRCGEVDRERKQTKVTPLGLAFLAARYPKTDGPTKALKALKPRAH